MLIPYQLIIMTFKLSDFISVSFKVFFLVCSFAFFLCAALFCFVVVLFFFFALTRIKPFGYKSGDSTGNEQNKKILPG